MAKIELHEITKAFAGGQRALDRVSLTIEHGERLALVGPSGSGKSTLLRIIAGLDEPTGGRVVIDGDDVTGVPPERRDLAMVFQSYALYPHKSVRDNLAFGLRMRRVAPAEIRERVERTARALGLAPLLDRRPSQLSGGQRQRVALGRALVREPRAFLFDEPLSNLDPRLRGETRVELVELHARVGATMVYVTHDQEEAMTLGQRIAVLRNGRLEQTASPHELYRAPATIFVAQFVGSPAMNVVPLDAEATRLGFRAPAGARAAGIRPHDIRLADDARRRAVVDVAELTGPTQHLHLGTEFGRLVAAVPAAPVRRAGDEVGFAFDTADLHFFDEAGRRITGDTPTR